MKLNYITGLLFAAAIASVFVLGSAERLSCAGSPACHFIAESECNVAWRSIVVGNEYMTGGSATETGVCYRHCGIFVEGSLCTVTGQQMYNTFHALRDHGCPKCGSETLGNGCKIKVDFVTGCR